MNGILKFDDDFNKFIHKLSVKNLLMSLTLKICKEWTK